MRIKTDRTNRILEILTEKQKVEVVQLARLLEVSQVTIRKDLDDLESRGIISREHGCAVLRNSDDICARIAYHYDEKKRIAQKASEMVKDGETLMIENGSCCALLADALAEQHQDLTIITNSAFIASYIRNKANFQIVLLGGIFQPDNQVMVGPMVKQAAQNFYVNSFFIGTDGYSDKVGFTGKDQLRAQAIRDMATQAESVVVVAESKKFSQRGTVPLGLGNQVKTVITDNELLDVDRKRLQKAGISVVLADQ
jgi:DeoR/GlpR family transcriptional regulator of sugar metabolism